MRNIRVAAASINQTPLDIKGNTDRIISVIKEAIEKDINILCLPELCITGYGIEDSVFSSELRRSAYLALRNIYKFISTVIRSNIIVSVGLPMEHNNCLYNVAAIISYAGIHGFVPKKHLCSDGLHYENRWFKAWTGGYTLIKEPVLYNTYTFGDIIFNIDGVKIGFEICEDSFINDRPGIELSQNCVDIILNPSASHFAFGKHETRKRIVLEGSRAFKCSYVYSNLLGCEAGRSIYSGDTIIASNGTLLADGILFSYKDYILTTAIIDVDLPKTNQLMNGSFKSKNTYLIKDVPLSQDKVSKQSYDNIINQEYPQTKLEEFTEAVPLALYDYMRKSNSNGFVLSLSGGADSAACACLVDLMNEKSKGSGNNKHIKEVLTTVYQATHNSSESTKQAAKSLSSYIGSTHYEWDVDYIKDLFIIQTELSIGRKLTWGKDDIALQNVQARVRTPGIWMLSNIDNKLLICTSNRSESAVGYCTVGGDNLGSLAPLAGIDKPFILEWLQYIYETYNYFGLEGILNQMPTAELRPSKEIQSDEKDLMPYTVLDAIEKAAMRDKKFPKDVLLTIMDQFPDYTKEQLKEWTRKFFKLFVRNQWKREVTPVSFHLDDESLDPKTWLRWPVLCGNLEEFLKEMGEV